MKAAYRASTVGELDALCKELSKWLRRSTIAHNKLAVVRGEIIRFADTLAREADKAGRKGKVLL